MPGNASAVQVRIQATSAAGAGGQRGHDLRLGAKPGYVAGERTPLNRVLVPPLTGAELRRESERRRARRATRRAMKSNAGVGVCGIVTFGHAAQPLFERLSPDAQDAAYREVAEAVARRLGTDLTGLVVHRDESAPHAHFQLVGYCRDGTPVSTVAKRGALRDLQTLAAEVMGRHAPGIERGFSKIARLQGGATPAEVVHRSVAELHDELPHEIAALRAQVAGLEGERTAAEEKARRNEALARKAEAKVQRAEAADAERARKAARTLEAYERRGAAARAEAERLEGEAVALRGRLDALEAALARAEETDRARAAEQRAAAEAEAVARDAAIAALEREVEREREAFEEATIERARTHAEIALHGEARTYEDDGDDETDEERAARLAEGDAHRREEHDAAVADWRERGVDGWPEVLARMPGELAEAEREAEAYGGPNEAAQDARDRFETLRLHVGAAQDAFGPDHPSARAVRAGWATLLAGLAPWQERVLSTLRAELAELRRETGRVWAEARALWAQGAEKAREALARREEVVAAREREARRDADAARAELDAARAARGRAEEAATRGQVEAQARFDALLARDPQLRQWTSFATLLQGKVRTVFGEAGYAELRREMAPEWERHPDNLARAGQRPGPGAGPSGP